MAFSASDAAFEGFRLTREKPVAILIWAAVYLVINLLMSLLLVGWAGEDLAAMRDISESASPDPAQALAAAPGLAKLYAVTIPIGLVTSALFTCAVFRAVLRPQQKGFGYLRFGADELRMILLFIALFFIFLAVALAATIGMMIVAAVAGFAAGAAGGADAGGALGVMLGLLGMLSIFAAMIWIAVRLGLAGPMAFVEGRLDLPAAWRMTRGHFWGIFGAWFLAWVLAILVLLLGGAIFLAVAMATGGGISSLQQMMNPDTTSFEAYLTPTFFVGAVFSALLTALQYAIVVSPPAIIYRQLKGTTDAETFA